MACGGHSRGQPSRTDGGSASVGGTTSTAGATSSAGASTNPPEPCAHQPLARRCGEAGSCPNGPSDFEAHCARDLQVRQAITACGGTAVDVSSGYGNTTWYFAASGTLTGAVSKGDVLEVCPDGHTSSTEVYGTTCEVEEPWVGLCAPVDRCNVPPVTCDGAPSCNESMDAVVNANCNDTGALSVTSSQTTCGGTMIIVDRGNGSVRYCFDERSAFVGMSSQGTGGAVVTLKGSDCYPKGDVALACPP
jgi:hypothetical protein